MEIMTDHLLKSWVVYFNAILQGRKTFDYRKNDRDFKIGDTLQLREWDPEINKSTGRRLRVLVQDICHDIPGMPVEYCIMSIKLLEVWEIKL